MARQKIREFDAKKLIFKELGCEFKGVLVEPTTNFDKLTKDNLWLLKERLVIKPDMLFGKRGKLGLVLLNADFLQVKEFLKENMNKEITIEKAKDKLTHFLIELYVEHEKEYYLAITSEIGFENIIFSQKGGIDIEKNKEFQEIKVEYNRQNYYTTYGIATGSALDKERGLKGIFSLRERTLNIKIPDEDKEKIIEFMTNLYQLFLKFNFTYLEFNPFTFNKQGDITLLDTVAEVDDCSLIWKNFDFPKQFGQKVCPEEEFIRSLDKESGASLKLTVLNPKGRIWNILSGGGASILYLDAIFELGKPEEIANYGEYSGNPTTEETYQYAKTILSLMTKETHPDGKVLIIGGAIANFTDVEQTFLGIIKALREYQEPLKKGKISIFVRRGGPNYEKGLALMEKTGKELEIPMLVHSPDFPMTDIESKAIEALK